MEEKVKVTVSLRVSGLRVKTPTRRILDISKMVVILGEGIRQVSQDVEVTVEGFMPRASAAGNSGCL